MLYRSQHFFISISNYSMFSIHRRKFQFFFSFRVDVSSSTSFATFAKNDLFFWFFCVEFYVQKIKHRFFFVIVKIILHIFFIIDVFDQTLFSWILLRVIIFVKNAIHVNSIRQFIVNVFKRRRQSLTSLIVNSICFIQISSFFLFFFFFFFFLLKINFLFCFFFLIFF